MCIYETHRMKNISRAHQDPLFPLFFTVVFFISFNNDHLFFPHNFRNLFFIFLFSLLSTWSKLHFALHLPLVISSSHTVITFSMSSDSPNYYEFDFEFQCFSSSASRVSQGPLTVYRIYLTYTRRYNFI